MEINENILKVLKSSFISPEHAALMEQAQTLGKDLRVTLIVSPGEFSHKPLEDGKFNAIYRTGIQRLDSLEIV
jgi:hypothetical protein